MKEHDRHIVVWDEGYFHRGDLSPKIERQIEEYTGVKPKPETNYGTIHYGSSWTVACALILVLAIITALLVVK